MEAVLEHGLVATEQQPSRTSRQEPKERVSLQPTSPQQLVPLEVRVHLALQFVWAEELLPAWAWQHARDVVVVQVRSARRNSSGKDQTWSRLTHVYIGQCTNLHPPLP